jgi:hypothetical protein
MEIDNIHFSEEDCASIEACRTWARALYAKGDKEGGRLASVQGGKIINRSALQSLKKRDFAPDEQLAFLDLPDKATDAKGVRVNLHLIENSELYNDILAVLQKHQQKG